MAGVCMFIHWRLDIAVGEFRTGPRSVQAECFDDIPFQIDSGAQSLFPIVSGVLFCSTGSNLAVRNVTHRGGTCHSDSVPSMG